MLKPYFLTFLLCVGYSLAVFSQSKKAIENVNNEIIDCLLRSDYAALWAKGNDSLKANYSEEEFTKSVQDFFHFSGKYDYLKEDFKIINRTTGKRSEMVEDEWYSYHYASIILLPRVFGRFTSYLFQERVGNMLYFEFENPGDEWKLKDLSFKSNYAAESDDLLSLFNEFFIDCAEYKVDFQHLYKDRKIIYSDKLKERKLDLTEAFSDLMYNEAAYVRKYTPDKIYVLSFSKEVDEIDKNIVTIRNALFGPKEEYLELIFSPNLHLILISNGEEFAVYQNMKPEKLKNFINSIHFNLLKLE